MDYNELKYWIWLQCCFGADNKKVRTVIDFFGDAENVYYADEKDYNMLGIFSGNEMMKLCDKRLDYSEKTVDLCAKRGYRIIPYKSDLYPKRLSKVSTPPVVLYVLGELPPEEKFYVGMVGTRNAGEAGTSLSYNFGYDLAENDAVTVSGGAYGVDIYAHRGTVDAQGRTICVIGCGIDMLSGGMADYILSEIPERGAIVSEYPPGYPATKYTFPMRNRIISGMSDCTVVIRAGLGSGALITVKYALEEKRKIFAVPGDAAYANAAGVNFLIRNGFSAALGYNDILDWHKNKRDDSKDPNPSVGIKFLRTLAVKPDSLALHSEEKRNLNIPAGYQIVTALCRDGLYFCEPAAEQLELSDEGYSVDALLEPWEGAVSEEMTEQERIAEEREADIKYMNEMWQRQITGEPEPPSSPAYRLGGLMDSDEIKRAMELQRIIKKHNLQVGLDYNMGNRIAQKVLEGMSIDFVKKELLTASDEMRPYVLKALEKLEEKERQKKSSEEENSFPKPEGKTGRNKNSVKANNSDIDGMGKSDKKIELKRGKESKIRKKEEKNNKILPEELTENASAVYYTISETPIHVNEIKLRTGLEIGVTLAALTELQICGLVKKLPGGRYIRN